MLALTEVRARVATALAPPSPNEPTVLVDVVDAVEPPALMLVWADPWLTFDTSCMWLGALDVLCVASRVEPGAGIEKLEELVSYTVTHLQADDYPWPTATFQAPRVFNIGGIPLLGARVGYRVPVTIEGGS